MELYMRVCSVGELQSRLTWQSHGLTLDHAALIVRGRWTSNRWLVVKLHGVLRHCIDALSLAKVADFQVPSDPQPPRPKSIGQRS